MIKLDIYDRRGVLETYKLEYLPTQEGFTDVSSVEYYIDSMDIPHWKKTAFKNRLWCIVEMCHPKEFYRIYIA